MVDRYVFMFVTLGFLAVMICLVYLALHGQHVCSPGPRPAGVSAALWKHEALVVCR